MLEKYGHGGDLRTAEEAYGLPAEHFLDYSSNMNPFGPPPAVRQVLAAYADKIDRYPDPAVRGLRTKLAQLHAVDEQSILIGNGAAELIDLVVRQHNPVITGLAYPSFAEYGDAVHKIGGGTLPIPLTEAEQFELSEASLLQSRAADFYMIGSPNNPTGKLVRPELILKLVKQGATVVVDEAFMDFVPDEEAYSLLQEAAVNDRLFVIRSMTKFYAIPGIRLGYIVGEPGNIAELSRLQVPWSVNSLAQLIGEAVLDDEEFAAKTKNWLQEEGPWFADRLWESGLNVYAGAANYVLVRLPEQPGLTAAALQNELGRRGVLIRDASHFTGLDAHYCRFAIKLRPQNERFLAELKGAMAAIHACSGMEGMIE
ncbi:threonine-phosphate decarboxylase CobD [Paenibacillus radicis (ex Gao et al. 2016)]|uniref:threonine-phosphate decarboxylase n=1 Tax=Paenibacillus radicis (ex Gao et al. 2016) TaxID=1737354 RepID=A0A917HI31_9BACL|nr:threonine-phosphate decarboxylase CobD [Paenibacillus radicis (ex Gao et al. 2016)]GGG79910.1 threonine-phosphate decarboxylase [Paenibacillus radicis (ex Gao et al. 2016)]